MPTVFDETIKPLGSGLNRICGDVLAGVAHIAHISTEWHLGLVGLPHAFH